MKKTISKKFISFCLFLLILPILAGIVGNDKILYKNYDKIVISNTDSLKEYELKEKVDILQFKNEFSDTLFIISLNQCDPDYIISFWKDNNYIGTLQYDSKRNTFANVLAGNYFNFFSQKINNDELTMLLQNYIKENF